MPPSTRITCPVIKEDISEAKSLEEISYAVNCLTDDSDDQTWEFI